MAHKKKSKEFKSDDLDAQFTVALLVITLSSDSITLFVLADQFISLFVIEVKGSNIIVVVSVLNVILLISIKMDEIK